MATAEREQTPEQEQTSQDRAYQCVYDATDYCLPQDESGNALTSDIVRDLILHPNQDWGGGYSYYGASWVNLQQGSDTAHLHSCPFVNSDGAELHKPKNPIARAISAPLMVNDIKHIIEELKSQSALGTITEVTKFDTATNLNFASFLVLQLGFKIDESHYNLPVTKTKFENEYERVQHLMATVDTTQFNSERERLKQIADQYNLIKQTDEDNLNIHLVGSLKDVEERIARYEARVNQGELLVTALHKISRSATPHAVQALLNETAKMGNMARPEKGLPSDRKDLYISPFPGYTPVGEGDEMALVGWDKQTQQPVFLKPSSSEKNPVAIGCATIIGDEVAKKYDIFPFCIPIDMIKMNKDDLVHAIFGSARKLDSLHKKNIVHGDVKPEHIGLGCDGYSLLDYEHSGPQGSSREGFTPGYIDMKRIDQKDLQIDDDVYGFAVTLMGLFLKSDSRLPTMRKPTDRYKTQRKPGVAMSAEDEKVLGAEKLTFYRSIIEQIPDEPMKALFLKTVIQGDFTDYPNCSSLALDVVANWP